MGYREKAAFSRRQGEDVVETKNVMDEHPSLVFVVRVDLG